MKDGRNLNVNLGSVFESIGKQVVVFDNIPIASLTSSLVTLSLIHNSQSIFTSPFPGAPMAFIPHYAISGSETFSINDIKLSRSDGQTYGLTPVLDLPVGELMTVVKTTNQNFATTGLEEAITWSGVTSEDNACMYAYNAMTWTTGSNNVALQKPGLYLVNLIACWNLAASGPRTAHIRANTARLASAEILSAGTTNYTQVHVSAIVSTDQGGGSITVDASANQGSGAGLALIGAGDLTTRAANGNRTWMQVCHIANHPTYRPAVSVTGLLIGVSGSA